MSPGSSVSPPPDVSLTGFSDDHLLHRMGKPPPAAANLSQTCDPPGDALKLRPLENCNVTLSMTTQISKAKISK